MEKTEKLHIYVLAPSDPQFQAMDERLQSRQWLEVHFFSEVEPVKEALFGRRVDGLILVQPTEAEADWSRGLEQVLGEWASACPDAPVLAVLAYPEVARSHPIWRFKSMPGIGGKIQIYPWIGAGDLLRCSWAFTDRVRNEALRSSTR